MDIAYGLKEEYNDDIYVIKSDNKKIVQAIKNYRHTMESKKIDLIYNFEYNPYKDFIYYRNSGFNQVLAKIAKRKDIAIGFSFSDLKKSKNKNIILGRLMQNFHIAKKYGLKTKVSSFAKSPCELVQKTTLESFERLLNNKKLY